LIKAKNHIFFAFGLTFNLSKRITRHNALTINVNWIDYDKDGNIDLKALNTFSLISAKSKSIALFKNKGEMVFVTQVIEPLG